PRTAHLAPTLGATRSPGDRRRDRDPVLVLMSTVRRWVPILSLSVAILALVVIGVWALFETSLLTALPCGADEPSAGKHLEDAPPRGPRREIGGPTPLFPSCL